MRTEPILKLPNNEEISSLFLDSYTGSILVGTSQGRILLIERMATNAYLAGDRTIYASRLNCYGEESPVGHVNVKYGLMNKILELTNDFSIVQWKDITRPFGAEPFETVSGIFTTPVLWAGEDFGWWGDMSWNQTVSDNSRVVVAFRAGSTEENLLSSSWSTKEYTVSGNQSWNLDSFSVAGGYAQIKVVLQSATSSENPTISALVIPYHSRFASYFFVNKLTMTKGTSIRGGLMTAVVTVPRNTEIKWGISSGSGNWNDITRINPDKLFSLPENFGDSIKIGAKMLSYDNERYPSIDEFSVVFDSDVDNLINKD